MTAEDHHGDGAGSEPVRLARVAFAGDVVTAIVRGQEVVELETTWTDALAALAAGEGSALVPATGARRAALDDVTLEVPLEVGSDVFCVGLNYRAHEMEASELVDELRQVPIIFAKSHRAMAPPAAELPLSSLMSQEFDWEAELGVVIGRDALDVQPDDAWSYVAGYCVINDITARDVQKRHQQWHLGKNAPASTPIGPWVVERDALSVPIDAEIRLVVNGVEKQRSRTSLLIHDIPSLISLLSCTTTLRVGDVIATGTPSGVGFARVPAEYLCDGDVVETIVEGVGVITNVVRTTAPLEAGHDNGRSARTTVPS